MSKLLFFDIDGTLIDCNLGIYSISDNVKEALDKLKENGHDVFLATGRCKCFIVDEVMNYPFSGYVTCNGGYVEYLNQPIYKAIVPSEAIIATMELCDKYGFNYYFEGNDNIYVRDSNDKKHLEFCKKWGMKLETIIDQFNPDEIETYIGMIVVNDAVDIPVMVDALDPYFDIQRHQNDCSFDLTLRGVSKAVGICELVKRLNKDISNTIAFGDGHNDIEMLETVGLGVAMGNAVIEAKAAADYETDRIENDGIVKALKKFDLL